MRLDKFLKVARIIKRRTVANEICSAGRVFLNGKVAKPSAEVKVGDTITIVFGTGDTHLVVEDIKETVRKQEAGELYRLLEGPALREIE